MTDGGWTDQHMMPREQRPFIRRVLTSLVVLLVACLASSRTAHAQGFGGPGMGPGMGQSPRSAPKKPAAPNPNEPQTHAASGASDDAMRLGGAEPSLPTNPLEISPEVRDKIGTDADPERETGKGTRKFRLV